MSPAFKIFLAGILWGTIGTFVKTLSSLGADGALIAFLRMFWAFVIVLAISIIRHGRNVIIRDKKTLIFCAILGLLCNGLFNVFYTSSIKINGMGIACVLMYTAPVFTAIGSRIIFREKFSALKIFALSVNILGCVLTVTGGNLSVGNINLMGLLAGIGSGFCYGMAAVFGRLASEKTDSMTVSVYSFFFAVIFLTFSMKPDVTLALSRPEILWIGFLYGLIPTSISYVIYYDGLKVIPDTGKVPVIASIEPVTAVLLGMMIYNEAMSAGNFIGVAVVIASIIIMTKAK